MKKQLDLPFLRRQRAILARRRREDKEAGEALNAVHKCPHCEQWRAERDFTKYLHAGRIYTHARCNDCRYTRYRQSKRCKAKRDFLMGLRKAPCRDCGSTVAPEAKRFVCVRDKPSFNLSASWGGRRLDEIQEEAKKYVVVCANCASVRRSTERYRKRPMDSKLAELPPDLKELVGLSVPAISTDST